MYVRSMPDNDPEVKNIQAVYAVQIPAKDATLIKKLFSRYSTFFLLKKTVTWILRIKRVLLAKSRKLQPPDVKTNISISEIKQVETEILKCVQKESFPSLYCEPLKPLKKFDALRQLEPQMIDGVFLNHKWLMVFLNHKWLMVFLNHKWLMV